MTSAQKTLVKPQTMNLKKAASKNLNTFVTRVKMIREQNCFESRKNYGIKILYIKVCSTHLFLINYIVNIFVFSRGYLIADDTSYTTVAITQLPGRVFSPSDIWKKLSHPLLLHFPFGMSTYVHHKKYQGMFMNLPENMFFIRVPPLNL